MRRIIDRCEEMSGNRSFDESEDAVEAAAPKLVRRKSSVYETEELTNLLHGSDPVRVELDRLQNEARDKERELAEAQAEIKALKLTERAKEKAVEELSEESRKLDGKLKATELLLENKNLEVKRLNDEKKAALAAQFAAEATLRRVHAAQKDDDMPPLEAILAPLEAEIKLLRQEATRLQDDNRALDRLTKSKEAALLEAERAVQFAEAKASLVDELQNRNQELLKQIEICQEENKILDKMHRQKVAEVEKLSTTVSELEEAVLAGGSAANAVRDYQRQVHRFMEEKKTLERELARAKITANRVAVVVANEWKDANDKVMPVKQWLEERRFMQGEMQQLRDKLAIVERAARTEAQLKEKYLQRFKVLEEGFKGCANGSLAVRRLSESAREEGCRPQGSVEDANAPGMATNGRRRSSSSQLRGSISTCSGSVLKNVKLTSKSFDGGHLSGINKVYCNDVEDRIIGIGGTCVDMQPDTAKQTPENSKLEIKDEDAISGVLYDMMQKEVVALRKAVQEKDQSLKDKDDAIEMLAKKVDTLTKAMEVEAKKMRRELAAMEKEVSGMRVDKEQESKLKRLGSLKGSGNSSHLLPGRFFTRKPKALSIFPTFNKLKILRLAKTRFAYMIIIMERLIKVQDALRQTVMSDAWKAWPGNLEPDALKVQQTAFHPDMWNLAESLVWVMQPIYNVLRLTDREGCSLELIYEFMDKVGEFLNRDSIPGIRPERNLRNG